MSDLPIPDDPGTDPPGYPAPAPVSPQYAAPAPAYAPPSPPAGSGANADLDQLVQFHNSGVLTDEEFSAAKAKLLGI